MKRIKHCLLFLMAVSFACSAYSSGTYNARPPRVPAGTIERTGMDRAKYSLGQKIYTGKLKPTPQAAVDRAAQEKRLRELELRLPEKARRKANLTAMAGRLSAQELEALEYYIAHRYPSK